ncbi:MAG: TonB-dependent receptor [Gemmatimonadetes bacterium]|nr:TonB-dependent receptor [Gemmatimonadota bacterium]
MQSSLRGRVVWAFLVAVWVVGGAGGLAAQTTGKVQGRVTDAQTGQPLAGAQIVVLGTRLGNITNEDGYYFINNVPAGLQDIQTQYIGYQTLTVSDQRVLVGQTMTVNFAMTPEAIALEPITVEGERNPLVPRDKTVSKAIVTGDVADALPLDRLAAVITLQPGVVDYRDSRGHVVRGGRPGEAAVYVDGVLVRSFNRGLQAQIDLGTNAVEEVSVLTGGYGAEFGQAQSGIINYVTKTGGNEYSGAVTFGTDEILPNDARYGISRGEVSFGGPLVGDELSFHVAGTAEGREDANTAFFDMKGADTIPVQTVWFRPTGFEALTDAQGKPVLDASGQPVEVMGYEPIDGLGNRKPYSNQDYYSGSTALRFTPTDYTRLTLGAVRSRTQGLLFNDDYQFRPKAMPAFRNNSTLYRAGLEQILYQTPESQATLKVNVAYALDEHRSGQLADTTALEPDGPDFLGFKVSDYEFYFEGFTVEQYLARLDAIRAGTAGDPLVPVEATGLTSTQGQQLFDLNPSSDNPYGLPFWWTKGLQGFRFSKERTLTMDVDLDWQVNRVHRLGAGFELYKKHVENISNSNQGIMNAYDTYFQNVYEVDPVIGAFWVKDRMDIGEMVIDAGVRFDFYDSDARYPETPGLIYPYQADPPAPAGQSVLPQLVEQERIQTVSPRLGVAFPISDATSFRLSYGHFFQIPQFNQLFSGINTDISKTNTNTAYGRPIDPMKAVQFEVGISHLFNPYTVLDVTAYNKDKLADATYRIALVRWPQSRRGAQDARLLTNLDFGNVRGVDVRLTRRLAQYFTAILGYSLLDSKGTSSDPYSYIFSFGRFADPITGAPLSPAQAVQPMDFDQRHKVTVAATATVPDDALENAVWNTLLRNTNASFTINAGSGLPYTRSSTPSVLARGGGFGARYVELVNASRMPWNSALDAKITRGFRFAGSTFSVFVDVRNLINTRNVDDVYGINGSSTDPGDIDVIAGANIRGPVDLTKVDAETRLVYLRQQEMLERYGWADANATVVSPDEQRRARALAYMADQAIYLNYSSPRLFRVGFEYIF